MLCSRSLESAHRAAYKYSPVLLVALAHRGQTCDLQRIGIKAKDGFEVGLAASEFEGQNRRAVTGGDGMARLRKDLRQVKAEQRDGNPQDEGRGSPVRRRRGRVRWA